MTRASACSRSTEPVRELNPADTKRVAEAFGDLADMKTLWTHGQSAGVAKPARAAARRLRLPAQTADRLEVAALLEDLARVAISNAVWEKPGRLTTAERNQARMHAYHSERILATSEALAPVARVAGMHHERLDRSAYYRGCAARELPPAVRVLAAAPPSTQ